MHQGLGAPVGWAAGHLVPILAYFGIHALKGGTKYLSVNDGIESLQWIAGFAQTGVAVRKVKEAILHGTFHCDWLSFYNVRGLRIEDRNLGEFIEAP